MGHLELVDIHWQVRCHLDQEPMPAAEEHWDGRASRDTLANVASDARCFWHEFVDNRCTGLKDTIKKLIRCAKHAGMVSLDVFGSEA